jgi:hypothetical protein
MAEAIVRLGVRCFEIGLLSPDPPQCARKCKQRRRMRRCCWLDRHSPPWHCSPRRLHPRPRCRHRSLPKPRRSRSHWCWTLSDTLAERWNRWLPVGFAVLDRQRGCSPSRRRSVFQEDQRTLAINPATRRSILAFISDQEIASVDCKLRPTQYRCRHSSRPEWL